MGREQAILPIAIVIFGSFLFFWPISAKVLISRIQISGVSTTDEYITLYNDSRTTTPLTGWSLAKQTAGGTQSNLASMFPETAKISAFSYFLVAHRDYSVSSLILPDIYYTNSSYSLAANNSLLLYSADGGVADRTDWGSVIPPHGSPAANPGSGKNLVRLPNDSSGNFLDTDDSSNDFVESTELPENSFSLARPTEILALPTTTTDNSPTTTPNETPSTTTPAFDSSVLVLTELMPNPLSGDEWIEIYNSSENSFDLTGAYICDNRSSDACLVINLEGTIDGRSYKTFYITGSKLNNDGDSVILKDSAGLIIDSVDYGAASTPAKGESLARESASSTAWSLTTTPTPDAENIITAPPPPQSSVTQIPTSGSYTWTDSLLKTPTKPSPSQAADKVTLLWNIGHSNEFFVNSSSFFDAHLTADPRGGEIMYSWNFGDGRDLDGSRVLHNFTSSGIFSVSVHGTSTQGTIGFKTIFVKVTDGKPNEREVFLSSVNARPNNEDEEWIGVSGNSTSPLDLSGYKIGTDNNRWYVLPEKTVLKPFNNLKYYKTVTKLSLNNTGGRILLANRAGEVVDILSYGKAKVGEIFTSVLYQTNTSTPPARSQTTSLVLGEKISKDAGKKYYSSKRLVDIRRLPVGTKTSATGRVVSLPGMPYVNYFYLNDDSGGIEIYSYKKIFPILQLGDVIKVSGEISRLNSRPRLRISAANDIVKIRNQNTEIIPEQKNIIDIEEEDFGKLLILDGEITDLNNASFFLDDSSAEVQVGLPPRLGISKNNLPLGSTARVTGIIDVTSDGFRIVPRTSTDVVLINNEPSVSADPLAVNRSNIAFGAGGVLLVGLAAAVKVFITKKRP